MCHEQELLDLCRRIYSNGIPDTGLERETKYLLDRIDEEEEAVRRERDPYGDDYRPGL